MKSTRRIYLFSFLALLLLISGIFFANLDAVREELTSKREGVPDGKIERRIRSILELPTYEHIYHNVIYIGEEARFLGIKHLDKRLLFSIDVTVQAGIDISDGIKITRTSTGKLRIALPSPGILLVDADESSIREYFSKELGGKISRLEYYDEIAGSKKKTVRDAIDRGILDISGRHAKILVRGLLESLGLSEAYVYFRDEGSAGETEGYYGNAYSDPRLLEGDSLLAGEDS